MSEVKDSDDKKLSLGGSRTTLQYTAKKVEPSGQVRQSFSHGRSKQVVVETKKKRTFAPQDAGGDAPRAGDAPRPSDLAPRAPAPQGAGSGAAPGAAGAAPAARPAAPQVAAPQVTAPQVTAPQVTAPQVTAPQATTPQAAGTPSASAQPAPSQAAPAAPSAAAPAQSAGAQSAGAQAPRPNILRAGPASASPATAPAAPQADAAAPAAPDQASVAPQAAAPQAAAPADAAADAGPAQERRTVPMQGPKILSGPLPRQTSLIQPVRPATPVEAPPQQPAQGPRPVAGQVLRPQPIPGARPSGPGAGQNQGPRRDGRDGPGNRSGAPAAPRQGQPAGNAGQQSRTGGAPAGGNASRGRVVLRSLTEEEKAARLRALEGSRIADQKAREQAERDAQRRAIEEARLAEERAAAAKRQAEEDARRKAEEESKRKAEEEAKRRLETSPPQVPQRALTETEEDDRRPRRPGVGGPARPGGPGRAPVRPAPAPSRGKGAPTRRDSGKVSIVRALDDNERTRSLSAIRRARERERRSHHEEERTKVVRDVVVPESITVQELANRMAERAADVIKRLMSMGVMATINQSIDADTAELLVQEFGHRLRRVSESDVEVGLTGEADLDEHLLNRAPVVTIMGHVDHGKTSLLDALRATDVAAGEAGGITQHIGAYQVQLDGGQKITFLDTPGHEAFTAMRARGAKVTDIVVLVVAADDGVMPQTIEAIRHAKAADVPIIVAINKIDKPDANPTKVAQELLQYEIVLEEMGGDTLAVPVSAKNRTNLDKLEETILLQAELLDLKANPDRAGAGVVIEAQLDRGRGPVATVLVQRGTLRVGDIFVAGSEWGRVRALVDDRGRNLKEAGPSVPVEVLGLSGTPGAGDEFQVVEDESRAREVTSFRQRRKSETRRTAGGRATLEQMFSKIREGQIKEMPVVIKADVQGSAEAIVGTLEGLATDEVAVRILHYGVGGITESDINLAQASNAPIIAFNVRATKQARDVAEREGVEIRYYSVIYNLIDDVKQALSGMLSPMRREVFLGNAEIRQVFDITKVGKVAGCYVTEGLVKRGAKVRLIRDNVVIHEGTLSTLKRFKDEVREVRQTFECGMAFEHYEDIRVGDIIEAFEVEEIARTL